MHNKALRMLMKQATVKRSGAGGRSDPYIYMLFKNWAHIRDGVCPSKRDVYACGYCNDGSARLLGSRYFKYCMGVSKMDRVAEVALTKVGEFNSQNVANIAGAFSSMQHSAPELFVVLAERASSIIHTFQPQELAQLLWAFVSLYEPVNAVLESLDDVFKDLDQFKCCLGEEKVNYIEARSTETNLEGVVEHPVLIFNTDQLGNISWSYSVFWKILKKFKMLHRGRFEVLVVQQFVPIALYVLCLLYIAISKIYPALGIYLLMNMKHRRFFFCYRKLTFLMEQMKSRQPKCLQLYIYSIADKVIPAEFVESFIAEQKRIGHEVRACNFISTPHVDHMRNHPELYKTQLNSWRIVGSRVANKIPDTDKQ